MLPWAWKQVVASVPGEKPVTSNSKHLRPISLTPVLSKLAEDFMFEKYIASCSLKTIDLSQFSGIPLSSATHALISMVHSLAKTTDRAGSTVWVALFDYYKASNLVDHHILAKKVSLLTVRVFIKHWAIVFLMKIQQWVKLT